MNYTKLSNNILEDRFYSLSDPREVISAGNKDILNTPGFNIGQNVEPEAGTFCFTDPHAKHLF